MAEKEAKIIHKLSQDVINKICAGEVIHRPLNVVKELLENSLDAGATQVTVILKNGGLKSIVIQDNGHGIRKDDLEIVCNRFTTSKLSNFDDLQSLHTFGFRGEALASVSTISHLSITSRTADSVCGYRAEYLDGDLKPGSSLKATAANCGTTILVENLFYNMPSRTQALTSEKNEFSLVQDMITKYALLHSGKCSLQLKKHGESMPIVNTRAESSLLENISRLFDAQISSKILNIDVKDEKLGFESRLFFSSSDLNLKRMHFILFINNRLVESKALKNSLKDLFNNYLMKGGNPFVLIFLDIETKNIDVNVHPTKSEVCFLYENEIIDIILKQIERKLRDREYTNVLKPAINKPTVTESQARQADYDFVAPSAVLSAIRAKPLTQTTLSTSFNATSPANKSLNASLNTSLNTSSKSNVSRPQKKQIRTDSTQLRIDQYHKQRQQRVASKRREFSYDSLQNLRQDVFRSQDEAIVEMFKNSNFVGCINENYFLIQRDLELLMINANNLNEELFYQLYLIDFGNFPYYKFRDPLPLNRLLNCYFRCIEPENSNVQEKIDQIVESLCEKAEMFDDYFSIQIDSEAKTLCALPQFIEDHIPKVGYLPDFLYRLATQVNFSDEIQCFHSIGMEFARFYSRRNTRANTDNHHEWRELLENRLYPLYKSLYFPSSELASNGTVTTLTNTTNLYKVFERC